MNKSVQIKLLKIKYDGDSIGDDIRIEIEHPDGLWFLDKQIKNKSEVSVDKIIHQFLLNQNISNFSLNIKIIEKDLVFNDVGSIKTNLVINLNNAKPQINSHEIIVKELRGLISSRKTARFEMIIKTEIVDTILYTPDIKDGWLKTLNEKNKVISLPAFLKVKLEYIKNNREYFIPLEGAYLNQLVSIKLQDNGSSYLISNVEHGQVAHASYCISTKIFTLNNKKYKTVDYPNYPWKAGLYDIEIPDYPHGRNDLYTEAQRQKIWFRIGHSGERYLHVGSRSLGCMTIIEINRWMEIYNQLIKSRKGDLMSVGVLEVID